MVGLIPVDVGDARCGSVLNVDLYTACNAALDTRNVLMWNALAIGAFLAVLGITWLVRRRPPKWSTISVVAVAGIMLSAWAPHLWRTNVLLNAGY